MSIIFDRLLQHAADIESILAARGSLVPPEKHYDWTNLIYQGPLARRMHLDVIDMRAARKLYMMHLCVFPHTDDGAPIYGFDIVAGPNTVTGAFHDYSPIDPDHPFNDWFRERVQGYEWSKPRKLPEWATRIFSKNIIAAGSINKESELVEVLNLSRETLVYYLDNIERTRLLKDADYKEKQNFYCQNQKQNPHTPRVLQALGFSQEMVHDFIHKDLFPELP